MPTYNLKLLFDPKDLAVVQKAKQRVALAKPVGNGPPNVIWLSIDPFQSTDVTWEEEYGIYASTTEIEEGAVISKLSEVTPFPAQDGVCYTLLPEKVFSPPMTGCGVNGTYTAINEVAYAEYNSLTFGLTQSALVNQKPQDRKPISAASVLSMQAAAMTPFTPIYMWLQAECRSETVITKIRGKSTVAQFGGGVNDITMKYDPNTGVFIPAS